MFTVSLGDIYNDKSIGTNNLIKEGAKLVSNIEDIVIDYDFINKESKKTICENNENKTNNISKEYIEIYNKIPEEGIFLEEIIREINKSTSEINYKITMLELNGNIKRKDGKIYKN